MVTTKRNPSTRSSVKNNHSSHSPFNDDDDDEEKDSKERHGKNIRNLLGNGSVTGNGVPAGMNITQNEHSNNYKNTNSSYYRFDDSWNNGDNKRNGGLKYYPEVNDGGFDPDIIPIKTTNMGNDGDGFKDDLKQILLPIDVIDSNISLQPFQSHQYKVGDEDNNTNTVSSGTQLN